MPRFLAWVVLCCAELSVREHSRKALSRQVIQQEGGAGKASGRASPAIDKQLERCVLLCWSSG